MFLHWCYEAVRRDGTIEFQVSDVAGYLDESYYTVRKWWSLVKDGPWFVEVVDRGKRGFRIRMADDWLEWRGFKSQSNDDEMHDRASNDSNSPTEIAVKSPSNENEMHNPVFDASGIKVLHSDQGSEEDSSPLPLAASGKPASKQAKQRKPRTKPEHPPAPIAIREAIAKGSQIDLKTSTQASIIQVNTAARSIWYECRRDEWDEEETIKRIRWAGRWIRKTQYPYSAQPEQRISPSKLVDLFSAAIEAYETEHTNGRLGTHQQARNGVVRDTGPPGEPERPAGSAERGKLRRARVDW